MNATTEPAFISLRHGMEYLMHHPHDPIIHSRKKVFKLNEISYQCFFKTDSIDTNNAQEYPKLFHT